jgi:hypothetical protein
MTSMGYTLWLASGALAFAIARIIPLGRRGWPGELAVTLLTAFALGVIATALDFGGWREPDPRAGLLCFFAAFAILGMIRVSTHKPAISEGRP